MPPSSRRKSSSRSLPVCVQVFLCVCVCAVSSAATPPDAVPTTEAGAKGSPAVPAEASALTDEQGAVLDGNEIKKACLSSEEKSSEEKRGGRWGAQGKIGKGSAG